jgi:hypothetical protein
MWVHNVKSDRYGPVALAGGKTRSALEALCSEGVGEFGEGSRKPVPRVELNAVFVTGLTSCGTSARPLTTLGTTWMSRAFHRDGRRPSFAKPCPAAWAEPSPLTSSGSQSGSCPHTLRWTGARIP